MQIVCAWCHQLLGEKEPIENKDETHGICEECEEKEDKKLDENKPV